MRVVYSMTRNLYDKIYPSLTSLREHNPDVKVTILCEDDSLPIEGVEVINVSRQQYFKPETCRNYGTPFSYMALLRVCYGEILPYKKIVNLDVDTIVCDSLQPLWDIDLSEKWIAACPEYKGWYKPYGPVYYNIGVSVFNLEQIREDKIQPLLVAFLNNTPTMCIEQDAFNLFGFNKFVPIPVRYNECFATGQTHNPAVVHYAGIRDWWTNEQLPRREYLNRYAPLSTRL